MSNRTCPNCKSDVAERQNFCGNCGQGNVEDPKNVADPPPTIMSGYAPQDSASMHNQYQSHLQPNSQQQHNSFQQPPSFQNQAPLQPIPYSQPTPKKTHLKKLFIFGGLVSLSLMTI